MEEWFPYAGLVLVFGTLVAVVTGIHTVLKAIWESWLIIKPVIVRQGRPSVLVFPTPDEIIRYSAKPFDWVKDDRTNREKLRDLIEDNRHRLMMAKQRLGRMRLYTITSCFILAFGTVAYEFFLLAAQ